MFPLVEIYKNTSEKMTIFWWQNANSLKIPGYFVHLLKKIVPNVVLTDQKLVFAGYGIVATRICWNDL